MVKMEHIDKYINEALSSSQTKQCEMIMKLFEGCGLTKDNFVTMLSKLEMKELQTLSAHISAVDNANYVAYQPKDDEFINESNKEDVVSKMADYFNKYISKKQ